jgi:glutathionylspermidine synthase
LVYGARPICCFLSPLVLPRSLYQTIARASQTLASAFERISESALEDEALCNELGLSDQERALALIEPGYHTLCVDSRFDAFLTETGFFFLEYNAESPSRLTNQMLVESILFDLPHMREFLGRNRFWRPQPHRKLLRALLDTYREWGGDKENPSIAIVDWEEVSGDAELNILKDYFESEGYLTIICDPQELRYDKKNLSVRGLVIDIVYKRVLISEFLERFDETHPLLQAYVDRKVLVASSFRTKIVDKKAGFAVLSDPRHEHLFTQEQITCVREHVPWTRRIRPGKTMFRGREGDLLDLVRRDRELFILKPNDDYSGHGVLIGEETEKQVWEQTIMRALEEPFVVQERVAAKKIVMPTYNGELEWKEMTVDFDPFLFRNEVEGGLVRLSSSSLCNVSSGGGVTALLVHETALLVFEEN